MKFQLLPRMKIRWTQINPKKNLTQRRKGAEKTRHFLLCAFAPLRELFCFAFHLCPSDFHLWQKSHFFIPG
jgi:hypothetical protein